MPARQAVRVSWTVAAGACRDWVTSGSAGRYMSIASGGVAVRPPRRRVTSRLVRRAEVVRFPGGIVFPSGTAAVDAASGVLLSAVFGMNAPPSGT
ncbi:hypothetical protein GCM10010297_11910 [Streptomyces malachitofuscus]|nr:hypothetical protein GCM10010297_11910 [Streptomyces malachitofuscus]